MIINDIKGKFPIGSPVLVRDLYEMEYVLTQVSETEFVTDLPNSENDVSSLCSFEEHGKHSITFIDWFEFDPRACICFGPPRRDCAEHGG